MLELLTRPLIIVFRFGIEVDEALSVWGSGFLGESDAGKADLSGFFKEFHGTFSGDEDVGGLAFGMNPFLLVLCRGNPDCGHHSVSHWSPEAVPAFRPAGSEADTSTPYPFHKAARSFRPSY